MAGIPSTSRYCLVALRLRWALTTAFAVLLLTGCATHSAYDRKFVSDELQSRAGGSLLAQAEVTFSLPVDVQLDDGLSEPEAVAMALWNNASLQVAMTQLGIARADLSSAGAFPNPVLGLLFPAAPARYEATLKLPVELLSRHSRVNAAREEVERVAALLVAQGLDLARDVRIAHAQAAVADEQQRLLQEQAALSADMTGIAAVQFATGKISEQSYATQRAQSAELGVLAANARQAAAAQRYRLNELLGLDETTIARNPPLSASALPTLQLADLSTLINTALQSRPEVQAATADIQGAGHQARWERNKLLNFIAELKVSKNETDSSTAPGVQFELPVFNQNQGGRSRATAKLERAALSLMATSHAIRREVSEAWAGHAVAQENNRLIASTVLPAAHSELEISREAYRLGQQSYFQMAQVQLRYLQAQRSAAEAQLALHNARAQLAHSLGHQPQQPAAVTAAAAGAITP